MRELRPGWGRLSRTGGSFWIFAAALTACAAGPEPLDPEARRAVLASLRRTDLGEDPSNPYDGDGEVVALGRALFFDVGLSANGRVSCATCHPPDRGTVDGLERSSGVGTSARHTPAIVGCQQGPWFGWDGRADSLWAQALGPFEGADELGSDRLAVVRGATTRHRDAWVDAYGEPPDLSDVLRFPAHARPRRRASDRPLQAAWDAMTPEDRDVVDAAFVRVGQAIAAYEWTLQPTDARFDRYVDAVLAGDPSGGGHLADREVRGFDVFVGAGCRDCHSGPFFTDRGFHNLGVPEPERGFDPGRRSGAEAVLQSPFRCGGAHAPSRSCAELEYLDPGFPDFVAAFKTPTLRNVARTAPYFHTGAAPTLEDVVDFYDDLDDPPPAGHRELILEPLGLSDADAADLIAFLGTLDGA